MPQDAFTLRYLCQELNQIFIDGKVNKIIQPSNDQVVLTIYTKSKRTDKLMLNVNPSCPRISIINEDLQSPLTAPNFCMLLRKHLLSSTILGVQLIGFDRIVKIDFLTSNEFTDSVIKSLYIELMGRYSNIILTENNRILGGNRGINMFDDGVRPLIVGKQYVFPPVGQKTLPTDKSLIEIFSVISFEQIATTICQNVQGVAQSTAVEIQDGFIKNYHGDKANFSSALFDYMNDYLFNTKLSPCVVLENKTVKDVCVYPYKNSKEIIEFNALYKAEEYYFSQKEKIKQFDGKKDRLLSVVNQAIKKNKKKLGAILSKQKEALKAEENRIKGELILSNIYRLKQGQKSCTLDNYYDGSKMEIELDENISISKNAENYYKKYNKQKRTLTALQPQIEQAQSQLNYYLSVLDEIDLCETFLDLTFIQSELEKSGLMVEKQIFQKKKETQSFCREFLVDNFKISVGRNNVENDKLTFTAMAQDVWLHAKDYHSSHVIIHCAGKKLPDNVLLIGAEICAYYSKGRESGKCEVVYTERKNVKKPAKSKLGFCTYENFKSLTVKPQKHAEFLKTE